MAIIAGMAYCIYSLPILSVPNAVGVFCPVILIPLCFKRVQKYSNSGRQASKSSNIDFKLPTSMTKECFILPVKSYKP